MAAGRGREGRAEKLALIIHGQGKNLARLGRNQSRKSHFTTKDMKSTKFENMNIRTLRVFRDLRGDKVIRRMVHR